MIKQLKIENFTVFPKADLQFASGLNVIVGENGCGKSHLLKLLYAISSVNTSQGKKPIGKQPNKKTLKRRYTEKLKNVFYVDSLESLVRYGKPAMPIFMEMPIGDYPLMIELNYRDEQLNTCFNYSNKMEGLIYQSDVNITRPPKKWDKIISVFIPTRELLTIYPGFISIYDNYYLEFDETYRDTCILLGSPAVKGKRERNIKQILKPLEKAMGGKVILVSGRFYLSTDNNGKIEMPMVAEGQRKLAMLAQLIATGALLDNGYLFWDEPESNLNPKLIKVIAKVILHLCNNGIQVFIATHSLFLLQELEILSEGTEFKQIKSRYFALRLEDKDSVEVEQGDTPDELKTLVLLDEELLQSDRYMELGD